MAFGQQLVDCPDVIANRFDFRPELTEVLDQVVGEGVVVVDYQYSHQAQSGFSQAISTARNIAFALLTDSSYSYSGFASATVPPPA